jgi:selenocysteine lyase/cysteine desulfurase
VPFVEHGDHRFVRVSIQVYNTPADGDALLAALGTFLPEATV